VLTRESLLAAESGPKTRLQDERVGRADALDESISDTGGEEGRANLLGTTASPNRERGETQMSAHVGDRIVVESERASQPSRAGVIEEVLREEPPRVRVRWEDGHTSILTPSAGVATITPSKTPTKA
jgi:hypothetical protein